MIVRARYVKNLSIVSKLDELYRFSNIYSNHANSTFRNCSLINVVWKKHNPACCYLLNSALVEICVVYV